MTSTDPENRQEVYTLSRPVSLGNKNDGEKDQEEIQAMLNAYKRSVACISGFKGQGKISYQ